MALGTGTSGKNAQTRVYLILQPKFKVLRSSIFFIMPFALKNPNANAATEGEKRAGHLIDDPSTPRKARKAPSAASLVENISFYMA